ncbi:MAG TPA: ParB/RepB/Spo0J family partition protein [Candidatus Binataceae bacterium]|nr:ParB/RepB/Spo0J family partition protein [Candidatus Binataceae bacterium]
MIRKPLGRGLDALIGGGAAITTGAAAAVATPEAYTEAIGGAVAVARVRVVEDTRDTQFAMIPADRIEPGKYQPRIHFDEERLSELQAAIQAQGIVEPLIVRRITASAGTGAPHYELIAGERRLRAARAAGLNSVPAIVRELDDRAALEMSLVENIVREGLSPIEEAIAFKRLVKHFALGHDEIAARIGKSRPYVSNQIRLLELPQEVIEMIAGGLLTAGQARPLLAIASERERIAAAKRILEGHISARGSERIAAARSGRREHAEGASRDPNALALAEELQRTLKRKVRIMRKRGRKPGRIEIDYYDDTDLTALASTLMGHAHTAAAARA